MQGYRNHHTGNGFLVRLAAGERVIDILAPQICAECGCSVDPEFTAKHRNACKLSDETVTEINRPARRLLE
jgi:hypothetical protein